METELKLVKREAEGTQVHWSESEWFHEWLRLARRDYQGRPDSRDEVNSERAPLAA